MSGTITTAVNSPTQSINNLTAKNVDLHSVTGDVATFTIPSYVTAYQVTSFKVTNCSVTPVLASIGLFTGPGATGTAVATLGTITAASSSSVVLSISLASTARLTASTLYLNLGVANAAALTADIKINIDDLS